MLCYRQWNYRYIKFYLRYVASHSKRHKFFTNKIYLNERKIHCDFVLIKTVKNNNVLFNITLLYLIFLPHNVIKVLFITVKNNNNKVTSTIIIVTLSSIYIGKWLLQKYGWATRSQYSNLT
jgi:hypothetical protein